MSSNQTLTGRSVFSVEITPDGVMVKTRFLTEDGQVLDILEALVEMEEKES